MVSDPCQDGSKDPCEATLKGLFALWKQNCILPLKIMKIGCYLKTTNVFKNHNSINFIHELKLHTCKYGIFSNVPNFMRSSLK